MDKKNIISTLTVGFMCSFVGQIFGFGGAIFFNPVQVFLGINPLVASTTSQYIQIFTNTQSVFLFVIFGKLNYSYTIGLSIFAGIGVISGMCLMGWYIKKFKRTSIIVFALGVAIIISVLFASTSNIKNLILQSEHGVDIWHGDSIC